MMPSNFATTRWSLVLASRQEVSPAARRALATLCQLYWYPLYAFARRQGHQPDDAQDLTQAFFVRLLEKDYLHSASQDRGKFRSFLLAAFKHFVSKERDRARANKRGGGRRFVPFDFEAGESRYSLEPTHEMTAERIYERRWALTVLDQVLARLQAEYARRGKVNHFEQLKGFLTGEDLPYRQVASALEVTEGALKVAVHRLRRRYRDLVVAEITHTVSEPAEVQGELRHLLAALSL